MQLLLILAYFLKVHFTSAYDYYGVPVGKLRNVSFALEGSVYLVNGTHLQVIDLNIKRIVGSDPTNLDFVFQNSETQKRAPHLFEYRITSDGDWLRAYEKKLREGVNYKRLIVEIPGTSTDWETFGIWNDVERKKVKLTPRFNLLVIDDDEMHWVPCGHRPQSLIGIHVTVVVSNEGEIK